jgi:FtsP/CotA-like multicopper oxidase with cupredoxin domain
MLSDKSAPQKPARSRYTIPLVFLSVAIIGVIAFLALFPNWQTPASPPSVMPPAVPEGVPPANPPRGPLAGAGPLDPHSVPRFATRLTGPLPVFVPESGSAYEITMKEFSQQILPPSFPATRVMGFSGNAKDPVTGRMLGEVIAVPGPTFEVSRGTPVRVTWINELTGPYTLPVDPTLHWADPSGTGMAMPPFAAYPPGDAAAQARVPTTIHLHGSETLSTFDGHPEAWYTADGRHGPAYSTAAPAGANAAVYEYPDQQPAATLWYHDHALGLTRLNVLSGLSGMFIIRDPDTARDPVAPLLPSGEYEMPLILRDYQFNTDGSIHFSADGANPSIHPYWQPEYFGDVITVNGKAWPAMDVKQGQYRFRFLDSSNARFYTMRFSNGMSFVQIGSDGGYLKAPVTLTSLTIGPAERADVLVDFSGIPAGTKIVLENSANSPFPDGDPFDPATTGQIMQFTVTGGNGFAPKTLPASLNPTLAGSFPNLPAPARTRILPLFEVEGPTTEPLMSLLNGQLWDGTITELPKAGSTEDWVIVDITEDAHTIHPHLIQFQLVKRQEINASAYTEDWEALNGEPPFEKSYIPKELAVEPYLTGAAVSPRPEEQGWKDTITVMPGQITVFRVRFAPTDGRAAFPFDPTAGPGYVWHCHILDHEDNEMMRPYRVVA